MIDHVLIHSFPIYRLFSNEHLHLWGIYHCHVWLPGGNSLFILVIIQPSHPPMSRLENVPKCTAHGWVTCKLWALRRKYGSPHCRSIKVLLCHHWVFPNITTHQHHFGLYQLYHHFSSWSASFSLDDHVTMKFVAFKKDPGCKASGSRPASEGKPKQMVQMKCPFFGTSPPKICHFYPFLKL